MQRGICVNVAIRANNNAHGFFVIVGVISKEQITRYLFDCDRSIKAKNNQHCIFMIVTVVDDTR